VPLVKIYADTSFLLALYSPDSNSTAAAQTMRASAGEIYVTVLGELELAHAMRLRVFRKELSESQVQSSLDDFGKDMRTGILQLRPLPEQVFERADYLSREATVRHGARTAELLHVAAAIELGVDGLYSFDQRQLDLARGCGLTTN
jgi:predicted nucleic acid-binding protein